MSSIDNDNENSNEEKCNSSDEEEEHKFFINKKELVHIEDDTSINVDKSIDEDQSKSGMATIKKGLIINNISAINEQLSVNNELTDKNANAVNYIDNSIIKEIIDNSQNESQVKNLNNNDDDNNTSNIYKKRIKKLGKIEPGSLLQNNNLNLYYNDLYRAGINQKKSEFSVSMKNNENVMQQNEIKAKTLDISNKLDQKEFIDMNILNENLAFYKKNNEQSKNDKLYNNFNSNKKKRDNYQVTNFNYYYYGDGDNIFVNKYNQLENNYYTLCNKYNKLETDYKELNTTNKSLLDLLTYWQKFYLEIKEIVIQDNKGIQNDSNISDCFDDTYRVNVINEVKKIIQLSKDAVYKKFFCEKVINFFYYGTKNKNLKYNKNWKEKLYNIKDSSFFLKGIEKINCLKESNQFLEENEDIDLLIPLKYPPVKSNEKINIGTNTDFENQQKQFDNSKLFIFRKSSSEIFLKSSKNNNELNKNELNKNNIKIISGIVFSIKGKTQKFPIKFKKNVMNKMAIIQTDITNKHMNNLLHCLNEKENMKKKYENEISELNNYIKNINNTEKISKLDKNNNNSMNKSNTNNKSKIFLPEMIPPENTYKIFINCIKNFKYEEGMYEKYIEEEDLLTLKKFVEKMEKFLIGTSVPVLKAQKKQCSMITPLTKSKKDVIVQNKQKEEKSSVKQLSCFNEKKRTISESKNIGGTQYNSCVNNTDVTCNRFKAAILSLKDN